MDYEDFYRECRQCPRKCGVNRTCVVPEPVEGLHAGFCRESSDLRIAFAGLHFGEEPLITVFGGSGTIFFTGCTLRCAFCQNYQISQDGLGRVVDSAEFTDICLKLQTAGAENINLVTGSHHIPKIAEYLQAARDGGVTVPFCWNSSAYESVEMLELLKGLVTIWLPDLKTLDSSLARDLFAAPNYPSAATAAIRWMIENNPLEIVSMPEPPNAKPAEWAEPGQPRDKMMSGVIIRHLFMPGKFEQTAQVLEWLKDNADGRAIISLMNQYTPVPFKETDEQLKARHKALLNLENRLVSPQEDADIQDLIEAYDFEYLFYQELTDDTSWLPDFTRAQPFSNKLATPIWHC
ncbi:MAG: radical SAM protein [Treponema sp.]|nr:radical SAM protein [Treponema sp.]